MIPEKDKPDDFPAEEELKMLGLNPWRSFCTDHDKFNNTYMLGHIAGKFYGANKILKYIKEKGLNKEDYKEVLLYLINP